MPLVVTVAVPLVALLAAVIEMLRYGGAFASVDHDFGGRCRELNLAGSSEHIQIDRRRGVAYLSLLDRDEAAAAVTGTITLLDLNLAELAPRAAMSYDPPEFRPQGMSLWQEDGRPARLFVVSHHADGSHVVEIADQTSSGFAPTRTVRDAAFTRPVAIAAAGPEQFYVVNAPLQSQSSETLDLLRRSGNATLVYYDARSGGKSARVLASDLARPAGLALSADGSRLYVAESIAKALRVYARDRANGNLSLEETIELGSAPANLDIDEDGVIWIAAQPKLLRLAAHARDSRKRAPTQVLRFDPRASGAQRSRQVYLDDGRQLSAGTVAARWRDEFLVGALLDKKVLVCKPNP
jgi:arylesterase / paraoxonase